MENTKEKGKEDDSWNRWVKKIKTAVLFKYKRKLEHRLSETIKLRLIVYYRNGKREKSTDIIERDDKAFFEYLIKAQKNRIVIIKDGRLTNPNTW